jgi:hypothetical protein
MDITTILPTEGRHPGWLYVWVCGGRHFDDEYRLGEILEYILEWCQQRGLRLMIIEGGAAGADRIAHNWANEEAHRGLVYCETVLAEWTKHGPAAGPIRNQRIVDEYQPDLCVAMPGNRGTADAKRRCRAASIPIFPGGNGEAAAAAE